MSTQFICDCPKLIEQFIDDHLANINDIDRIEDAFDAFWQAEKEKAFTYLVSEENLIVHKAQEVIETYLYEQRPPLKEDIANTLSVKPKLLERKVVLPRVQDKLIGFVEQFYDV